MADPQRAHEPTMEEILASIRRIISDDGEAAPPAGEEAAGEDDAFAEAASGEEAGAPDLEADMKAMMEDAAQEAAGEPEFAEAAQQSDPAADDDEDVFELTDEMAADEPEDEAETVPADFDFDALDTGDEDAAGAGGGEEVAFADIAPDEPEPEPAPAPKPQPRPAPAATAPGPGDGLLSSSAQQTASAAFGALASTMLSHSGGARTLEQIVEDLLRPLLKAWLDEQLPPLVERLVREEIERVARRTG